MADMAGMEGAAGAIKAFGEGIDTAKKALDHINELIDQAIPWKEFKETMHALKDNQDQYSNEAAPIVGQISQLLLNSCDRYKASVNSVDRWCQSAVQLLRVYIAMFADITDTDVAEAQKSLMLTVLNNGQEAISNAIDELEKSNESFNTMAGKIVELKIVFNNDFREGSAFYDSSVSKLRREAYLGAASAVLYGPIGLAISYSIAAGVVEGEMIPNLKKAFKETEERFDQLKETLITAQSSVAKAKQDINQELTSLNSLAGQIDVTTGLAESWSIAPSYLFTPLKENTETLIAMCTDYSSEAQNKIDQNWG